ncbi:MAG TPA: YihY/virulence factor BrkB family protein, partial [Bryobacteraceae bacterium]|nr:YihY/virulence factor BrkB family protein [Bryobacteraceae bacterium]
MQERRIWPLAALAALTAVSVARRPGGADGRPERRSASALLREPREEEAIAPPRPAARAWAFFRPSWRAVPWRVYQKMNDNRLLAVAAGVVFYGLLALFPALTAFVSLYGLVADPSSIQERLSLLSGVLPQGALDIVNEQLTRLTAHRTSALSVGFIGGLLLALWSANAGSKAIMDGLNVAYGETEKRGFLRLNLVALAFTLGALLAVMLALCIVVGAPLVLAHFGLGGAVDALIRIMRWPALLALVVLGLTVLYRYGPSLKDPQWTWLFPGNVIAAIGWLAASALFSWYIANFGTYDATYGSLGAAIGMMMWMWIS